MPVMHPPRRRLRTVWSILVTTILSLPLASARFAVPCPSDPSINGYVSIADLNDDMQYEIRRIEQVPFLVPNDTYHYTLCPHTAFDGSDKLTPILDNTTISCGSNGWSGHNCTLVGGTVQVNIVETPWFADYPVRRLAFRGLTFANFTEYGVAALAPRPTEALFQDCHWRHGTGEAAVQVSHVPLGTRGRIMVAPPPDNIFERPGRRLTDVINDGTGSEALEKLETKDSMSVTLRGCTIASNYGDGFRVLFNQGGQALLENVTIGHNQGGILINTISGETEIRHSFLFRNEAEVLLRPIQDSTLQVHGSVIAHNQVLSTIVAKESRLIISQTRFRNNTAPAGMTSSGSDFVGSEIMGFASSLDLQDSCFVESYANVPVFVDHQSFQRTSGLHAELNGTNIDGDDLMCGGKMGMFLGEEGSTCLVDGRCDGECQLFDDGNTIECTLPDTELPPIDTTTTTMGPGGPGGVGLGPSSSASSQRGTSMTRHLLMSCCSTFMLTAVLVGWVVR